MRNYCFKQLLVTFSLILFLECFQLLLGITYYPISKISIAILKSASIILVLASFTSAIINLTTYYLTKFTSLKAAYFETAFEILCVIALGLFYIPAFILVFKTEFSKTLIFFWQWGYGIIPFFWTVIVIASNIWMRERFKRIYQKLIGLMWRPAYALLTVSFIWLAISIPYQYFTNGEIEAQSPQLAIDEGNRNSRPNIILITFDQLSAKYMSLYGYPLKTTPFWDKLARESYVFENFRCNICETTPALVSLLSSKYPWTTGVLKWLEYLKTNEEENIATVLADDYYTAALTPSMIQLPDVLGFTGQFDYQEWVGFYFPDYIKGFNRFYKSYFYEAPPSYSIPILRHHLFLKNRYSHVALDEVFRAGTTFLEDLKERPFFLWTHHWLVHAPHRAPLKYKGLFSGQTDQDIENYNEYILFSDNELSRFFDYLKASGLYDNSIIIISSDHGVAFGLDKVSSFLYEPFIRIPLLIHLPNQKHGERIPVTAEHVDLVPTILDLVGKQIPEWMEGESLVPYLQGRKPQSLKTKFTLAPGIRMAPETHSLAVFKGEYKLIYQRVSAVAVLYNVVDDPQEKTNLAHRFPRLTSSLIDEALKIYSKMEDIK